MRPILFEIGALEFHGWGVMVGLGLLAAYVVLRLEHGRRGFRVGDAALVYMIAIVAGVVGAKFVHVAANPTEFYADPIGALLSPSGFMWYGAVLGGLVAAISYIVIRRLPIREYLDMLGLGGAVGYGLGRLGCHLAGDGDYGRPTELLVGTLFANGVVKPAEAAADFFGRHPALAERWSYYDLTSVVVGHDRFGAITAFDAAVSMHPSSAYEFGISMILFGCLWVTRARWRYPGTLFATFIGAMGIQRVLVEFIRMEPKVFFFLTRVQVQSVVLVVGVIAAVLVMRVREDSAT